MKQTNIKFLFVVNFYEFVKALTSFETIVGCNHGDSNCVTRPIMVISRLNKYIFVYFQQWTRLIWSKEIVVLAVQAWHNKSFSRLLWLSSPSMPHLLQSLASELLSLLWLASCLLLALTSERMAMMTSPHFQNESQIHLWHSYAVTQKKTTNQVGIFCYAS